MSKHKNKHVETINTTVNELDDQETELDKDTLTKIAEITADDIQSEKHTENYLFYNSLKDYADINMLPIFENLTFEDIDNYLKFLVDEAGILSAKYKETISSRSVL